jgi:hypothetical protein
VSTQPHDRSYEVTRHKNSSSTSSTRSNGRANGHAGPNGHAALESASVANTAESDGLTAHLHLAGSDDSIADPVASSASSAGARTNRDVYAELAQADPAESAIAEGKWLRPPGAASQTVNATDAVSAASEVDRDLQMSTNTASRGNARGNGSSSSRASRSEKSESAFSLTPPGTEPLPLDGATFVEAVHERVDLIALEEQLLRSADKKIVQRELAYLRELRYGKTASFATDDDLPPRIVFDRPDPLP